MAARVWHPIIRYAAALLCLAAAMGLLFLSAKENLHSVPWLVGVFTTAGLLIAALRSARTSILHRSYALYLAMLNQYLLVVWLLHFLIPGHWPVLAKSRAAFWAWILYPGVIFNAPAQLHFALRFAESRSAILKWIERAGWAVSFVFLFYNFAGRFVDDYRWTGVTWVPTLTGGYGVFFPFTTFFLMMGIVAPLHRMFTCRARQKRLQLFYYLLGATPLWLTCWGNFLISWGINIYPAGGLLFLLHVGIIAYAVFKHQLFDFTIIIRRGLAYAAVSLILGMLYGTAVWASTKLDPQRSQSPLSSVVFVLLVGLICAPLWSYFQNIIDRLFFRTAIARERLLERVARESAATVKLDVLAASLLELLDRAFKPRSLSLYVTDEKGRIALYGTHSGTFQLANWPAAKELPEPLTAIYRNSEKAAAIPAALQHESRPPGLFTEEGNALLVPILHGVERLGCLLLEPRKADEAYTDEDRSLIEAVAASISTALLNARAYTRLEQVQALTARTFDGLSAVVMVISQSGKIVQSNKMALQLCQSAAFPETLEAFTRLQRDRFLIPSSQ